MADQSQTNPMDELAKEFAELDAAQLPGELDAAPVVDEPKTEDAVVADMPTKPEIPVESATIPDNGASEKPPALDENIKISAREWGFTDSEIDTFATSEQLDAAVSAHARRMSAIGKSASTAAQPPKADAPPAPPAIPPAPTGEIPRFELTLSKEVEEDHPEVAKALRAMNDFYMKQLADVHQNVVTPMRQMFAENQARTNQAIMDDFDAWLGTLPKEYESVVGKGRTAELNQNSDAFKKRFEILQEAGTIANGYINSKLNRPSNRSLFDRGARFVLADIHKEIVRKEEAEKIRQRKSQMSSRPGTRSGSNGTAESALSEDERLLAVSGLPD